MNKIYDINDNYIGSGVDKETLTTLLKYLYKMEKYWFRIDDCAWDFFENSVNDIVSHYFE